jgi:hypothetical protein
VTPDQLFTSNPLDVFRPILLILFAVLIVVALPAWVALSIRRANPYRKARHWALWGGLLLFGLAFAYYCCAWQLTGILFSAPTSDGVDFTLTPRFAEPLSTIKAVFLVSLVGGPWLAAWGFTGKEFIPSAGVAGPPKRTT